MNKKIVSEGDNTSVPVAGPSGEGTAGVNDRSLTVGKHRHKDESIDRNNYLAFVDGLSGANDGGGACIFARKFKLCGCCWYCEFRRWQARRLFAIPPPILRDMMKVMDNRYHLMWYDLRKKHDNVFLRSIVLTGKVGMYISDSSSQNDDDNCSVQ